MKDKKGRFKKGYASEYGKLGGSNSWLSKIKGMSKEDIHEMMKSNALKSWQTQTKGKSKAEIKEMMRKRSFPHLYKK